MKVLKSELMKSISRNPENHDVLRKAFVEMGYGRDRGVTVTVRPMDKDGTLQHPVRVKLFYVPAAG